MIDLGRPALHAEGVTVFADHAEPARFHFLPDRPRLRRREDGTPDLSLLEYRLDPALHKALGAGMLSLTVDLGVDEDVLDRLRSRLKKQIGLGQRPILAPVVADSGHCEIVLIDRASRDEPETPPETPAEAPAETPAGAQPSTEPREPAPGSGLVTRILGATSPSLYGDNAATLMAVLSAEGVALVEGALRGGGLPVGVVYSLSVLGLRPALRATITARFQDIYHYYENRLHGGKLLLAVDIGKTTEELVRTEALSIHIDELVPEEERSDAYDRALAQAQRYILEELFKPTLGQAPPPADAGDDALATIGNAIKDLVGFFSITYTLRHVDRSELKTLTYRLDAASAERLTLAPQGTLTVLLDRGEDAPKVDLASLITIVQPAAAAEMRFDVGTTVDLAAEGIDRIEARFHYGEREVNVTLDAGTPRAAISFWHDAALGHAVRYTYEVHFTASGAGAEAFASPSLRATEVSTEARVIRIDPRALYRKIGVRAVARGVPFDRFPLVIIDLRMDDPAAGWSAEHTLTLDAEHPEASWTVRAAAGADVRVLRRLRYSSAGGQETTVDWDTLDIARDPVLVAGDPFPEILDVQIVGSARFDTEVARIIVELRPASAPDRVASRVLTREQPAATWSSPLADPEDRAYDYRVTVHTVRNEVREGEWLRGAGATLVVGEGIGRLRAVQLIFVGRSLADLGLIGVKVRFSFEDPEADLHAEEESLVVDTKAPVRWSYPVADPARQAYTYQLTYIHADGRIEAKDPVTASDLLVICPLT